MKRLTPAQQEVAEDILTAFRAYVAEYGVPPSRRELAAASGYTVSVVQNYLQMMEAAGLVVVEEGRSRGITLVE